MRFSVIICTRNRAASLRDTLEAVFDQTPNKDINYEVIVVDNGSTDSTKQLIAEFIATLPDRHHDNLKYCFEVQPGLSYARNRGLEEASGEIIVFTDDDILPESIWLEQIRQEFVSDPELHLFGGRVLLASPKLQPVSIITSETAQTHTSPEACASVIGANLAFRREVFDEVGNFDVRLGAGSFFSGGEDVEFLYRAMRTGYKLRYAPSATVYHNHDRLSHEQACGVEFNYGKGEVAYLSKHILKGDYYALKIAYWSLAGLLQRALGTVNSSRENIERARAHFKGFARAFFPAMLKMW
jgi:glycosyltransferase involved in cell wall biosynthesis